MKKVLIVCPHFPPVNTPDQHRIRMSLPFFEELGWQATVLAVRPEFVEAPLDPVLTESVPKNIRVVRVGAFSTKYTRKVGLGALSMRSLLQMRKAGIQLLRKEKFDLIYFSTTAFHVCWLGQYWKKKFKVPFVIDLQDPWRNDFYQDKPKHLRPPKHGFAYAIHKKMEKDTMPHASGVVSVSEGYLQMMEERYKLRTQGVPMQVIPFGASKRDFEIARKANVSAYSLKEGQGIYNIVYIGAVTPFFLPLIEAFFKAFLASCDHPENYHFHFLGTSYISGAEKRVEKVAEKLGMSALVTERTDRIPYYTALRTLEKADLIFIPGSQDKDYNASKVYNCILSTTPIFSIFNSASLVKQIIESSNAGIAVGVEAEDSEEQIYKKIKENIHLFFELVGKKSSIDATITNEFSDRHFTVKQVALFEQALAFHAKQ